MAAIKFNQDDFNTEFIEMMAGYAEALNVPLTEMMEKMLIRRFAEDRATINVYETGGPDLVLEFYQIDSQSPEPKELFKRLYFRKRHELERELYQRLKKVPKEDLHRLSERDLDIIRRFSFTPRFSWQVIKEQLQAEGDDVNDTEWTSEINPEDLK
jgi:hypothetical protein